MVTEADVRALLARVEGAEVGDGALEVDLALGLGIDFELWGLVEEHLPEPPIRYGGGEKLSSVVARRPERDRSSFAIFFDVPHYTRSVDAAIALAERVLPGWVVNIAQTDTWGAGVVHSSDYALSQGHPTPALAIVAAVLRALCAREGERGDG